MCVFERSEKGMDFIMNNKEIIEARDTLRENLENDIKVNKKKNEQIGKIVFYKDFELINGSQDDFGLIENEVFIVTRNILDENNNKIYLYEIYDEKQNLLAKTDREGKLTFEESYKEKLKNNFGKFYDEANVEERDFYLIREDEFVIGDKPYKDLNKEEKEELEEKIEKQKDKKVDEKEMDNPEIARKDLNYSDDDILYSVEIKDKRFYDQVPSAKEYEGNAMLIYSKKEGKFLIGGMVNGHFEKSEYIEPSMSTMKTSIDLDDDGEKVQRDNIHGILQIKNNPNYAYSIDIEPTGYIEFQELRIDRSKSTPQYVSADLETTRQYRSSKEVEYAMRRDTNHEISDEVNDFNRMEKNGKDEEEKIELDDLGDREDDEITEEERIKKIEEEEEEYWFRRGNSRER